MALKTNYQNDVLDTSVNEERTYNLVDENGNIIYEGVKIRETTALSTTGDNYGALEINETNEIINELDNDVDQINVDLSGKINTSDIINNLTSTATDKPLSANQGKVLNDEKINISDIVNNLTSSATNKPLSAAQGKVLKDAANKTTVDKSGSGAVVTNSIVANTSLDNVVQTFLNNDYAINQKIGNLPNTSQYPSFAHQWFINNGSAKFQINRNLGVIVFIQSSSSYNAIIAVNILYDNLNAFKIAGTLTQYTITASGDTITVSSPSVVTITVIGYCIPIS